MDTQHDSLAQVPINSVLIGIFTEKLKTITEPGSHFPEYITIQGGPATNTTARTYKFKTLDVFKYLDGIKLVIETMQDNFAPNEDDMTNLLKGVSNSSSGSSFNKSENISAKNEELDKEPDAETDAEPEETSEKDDAVAILDEPASSSELGETQEPITPNTNKPMNGGSARKPKSRRLKYSLKSRK